MLDTRLILVDGISGAGKSTAAQFLAMQLNRQGIPARWYHEDESENPVKAFYRPGLDSSPAVFCERVLAQWDAFILALQCSGMIHVVDGGFMQGPVAGLLLADADRGLIADLLQAIAQRAAAVRGRLAYLRPGAVAPTLERACASRYGALRSEYIARNEASAYGRKRPVPGFAGLVQFWEEVRALADGAYQAFEGLKATCDPMVQPQADCHATLLALLGLRPLAVPTLDRHTAQQYIGTYSRRGADGGPSEFSVRWEEGALVVYGLSPYLWHDGNRLIPSHAHVFTAAGWPTEAIFEAGADGRIGHLRLTTREQGWRRTDEQFLKLR